MKLDINNPTHNAAVQDLLTELQSLSNAVNDQKDYDAIDLTIELIQEHYSSYNQNVPGLVNDDLVTAHKVLHELWKVTSEEGSNELADAFHLAAAFISATLQFQGKKP